MMEKRNRMEERGTGREVCLKKKKKKEAGFPEGDVDIFCIKNDVNK